MIITEIKNIKNHWKAYRFMKQGKLKFDCPILILHQDIGCLYSNPLIVCGHLGNDLLTLLDELYYTYDIDNLPFRLYTYEDVIDDIGGEGFENYLTEHYYPLNGGEYFTDNILYIEEV